MTSDNTGVLHNIQCALTQAFAKIGVVLEALRVKIAQILKNLDLTPAKLIEICSYMAVGFFVGFLLKKQFKLILWSVLAFVGVIWLLGEFDLIVINWSHAQNLAHVSPDDTISTLFSSSLQWVKQHIAIVSGAVFGFVVGYRLG